jgi:hypothetical protein
MALSIATGHDKVTGGSVLGRLLRTVSLVGADTGGVHGQVTDVVLLVHTCEQVSQGSSGMDDDVIASVCLRAQGHSSVLQEVNISCSE